MDTFKDIQQDAFYNSYIYNLNAIDSHFYILLFFKKLFKGYY